MANSSLDCRRHHGGRRHRRNATGGWLAQLWLRTNYRALYLLSFWSVVLTLPCGAMLFFGPRAWAIPSLFAAEFFLFLNTGPLNAAIVNSVSAPVRATAISINLFCIHFFGDTFSPQIIGAISRSLEPQHRPGRNACLPCHLRGNSAHGCALRAAAGRKRPLKPCCLGWRTGDDAVARGPVFSERQARKRVFYFAGRVSWSRVFMNARPPPCERRLGSLTGGRLCLGIESARQRGLGLNFGGPP